MLGGRPNSPMGGAHLHQLCREQCLGQGGEALDVDKRGGREERVTPPPPPSPSSSPPPPLPLPSLSPPPPSPEPRRPATRAVRIAHLPPKTVQKLEKRVRTGGQTGRTDKKNAGLCQTCPCLQGNCYALGNHQHPVLGDVILPPFLAAPPQVLLHHFKRPSS